MLNKKAVSDHRFFYSLHSYLLLATMQTFKTSKGRENILSKIRKGLSEQALPMPFPEAEKEVAIYAGSDLPDEELFAENFIKLGGKFVFCSNEQELLENISTLYETREWQHMLCAEPEILQLLQNNKMNIATSAEATPENAEACITGCECIVARTGSVILSSRQNMGRTSSVFYPVHIIVVYANQLAHDIQQGIDLLKKKYGHDLPSMINLNTGPSRTADIEKTLVVGVHGPGEVFCLYVNARM
jgi:L-lactate dehydrogenase complex protein LldG